MAVDPRRFDQIERVVKNTSRQLDDSTSTLAARLAAHKHAEADVTSLVTDLAGKTDKSTLTTKGDLYAASAASTPARVAVGSNNQLLIADSAQTTGVKWGTTLASLSVTGSITTDASWNSFTFSNSWVDNTTARYRMMPDGTVQFKGIITKVANPTGGEIVITGLPAAYRPLARANFLCACGSRAGNGTQKIEVETDGTCKIWDMAAASGDVCLDSIRYPVI
jgi:hypothetical protein